MTQYLTFFRPAALWCCLYLAAWGQVTPYFAQKPAPSPKPRAALARKPPRPPATAQPPAAEPTRDKTTVAPAVTVVAPATEPDFLTGEAQVTVNPSQPTVVRLGLAQNATTIIEFPANDGLFYVHEGNPQLVTVFDSPTKESDRFITLYPGTAFVASIERATPPAGNPARRNAPACTLTLQMRSGVVLIFEIFPVADIRRNAHRVVVSYKREEVIAARQAAGLAVNLDGRATPAPLTKANSQAVGSVAPPPATTLSPVPTPTPILAPKSIPIVLESFSLTPETSPGPPVAVESLTPAAHRALVEATRLGPKLFRAWTPAPPGLSLAVAPERALRDRRRLLLVAVRNDTARDLQLPAGQPALWAQVYDETGAAAGRAPVARLYVETTAPAGLISTGTVAYYAIIYEAPALTARQRLQLEINLDETGPAPATPPTR